MEGGSRPTHMQAGQHTCVRVAWHPARGVLLILAQGQPGARHTHLQSAWAKILAKSQAWSGMGHMGCTGSCGVHGLLYEAHLQGDVECKALTRYDIAPRVMADIGVSGCWPLLLQVLAKSRAWGWSARFTAMPSRPLLHCLG